MKRLLILLFLLACSVQTGFSQNFLEPVQWLISSEKKGDDTYVIHMDATIDAGWHLYSQKKFGGEFDGPIATEITFKDAGTGYDLIGDTKEPDLQPVYDPVFDLDVVFFEDEVRFSQEVKITDPTVTSVTFYILFSVCDDKKCLAPEEKEFIVDLKSGSGAAEKLKVSEEDLLKSAALDLDLKGEETYLIETKERKSYLNIFLLGFVGGLIALLTPCVFPMIPLTVSFFTKGGQDRKKGLSRAIMYGLFIFLIYVLLSIPFHVIDGINEEILNNISTNTYLNVLFFVIFIVFAFSFFGYFELTLPSSWSSAMDNKASSIGGGLGIFFMALTLAIVSFSCTGPILGSLLGGSLTSDGGAMQLSMGMGGFGLALGIPFALFAMFPNMLSSLPKSGGWLNTVKVVLGFIELALAFKFFSNADLVEHWGLLKREVFIGIWILCALGLALYLLGYIRFPHDGPKGQKKPWGNKLVAVLSIAFMLYLIPGLTNTKYANLKLLSGFPPPLFYSIYDKDTEAPLGLEAYKDFDEGIAAAKASGKPIMIDFTGWACVNCRKMEEQVWSEEEVFKVLDSSYVLISLYVDDRELLDKDDQFNFQKPNGNVKAIKTIGDQWATFQTVNFKNNSQPYYILIDSDLNLLNFPIAYTPDSDEYLAWLQQGLTNFNTPK